jgi:hypothetical protein
MGGKVWAPATSGPGATDQSGSLIFGAQRKCGQPLSAALFGGGKKGIIFRPGATQIKCGKAGDSGGKCLIPCPARSRLEIPWEEQVDKFCSWPPSDFGIELQRLTQHQTKWQRLWYNEIIIDAAHWHSNIPDVVEAVFGERKFHEAFLREYGLSATTHPFISLHDDWDAPFF